MMKLFSKIKYIVLLTIIVLAVTAVILLSRGSEGWNFQLHREVKIDPTENVVQQIRNISELTTACYYQESVITAEKIDPNGLNLLMQALKLRKDYDKNKLALIVKGQIRAGFHLEDVEQEQVRINGDTLSLVMPEPQILDIIINPSGYEVFAEDGKWSHQDLQKVQTHAENQLKQQAIKEGILEKASQSGIEKLTAIFHACGFNSVDISFDKK